MGGLLKAIRVLGLGRLLQISRAHRLGWMDIISGFYTTRTMQALFNVGFFDELQTQGQVDVATFAKRENLDTQILEALCNSLYALGILDRNSSSYVLGAKGKTLVEVGRGWFDGIYGYEEVFHFLEKLLRKEKTYGRDIYRRPDFVAKGSGEMEAWVYFPLAIDIIKKQGYRRVLDLGCGDATFLCHLCKTTDVEGYGIDLAPEAIADGERLVAQAELQDRIQLTVADITKLDEAPAKFQQVDVATTFFVLHEILWRGRDAVIDVFQSFRRLFPDVPFIIFEVIRPTDEEMRRRPGMMVQYLLQHELTHQKLVTSQEWHDIFKTAGFTHVDEQYFGFARTAIFVLR